MIKLIALIPLLFFFSCVQLQKEKTSHASEDAITCKPYFQFHEVEFYHIQIREDSLFKIYQKKNKSSIEKAMVEVVLEEKSLQLYDTVFLKQIEKLGFVKSKLNETKVQDLTKIFCEKKQVEFSAKACLPIYRDILIFRKKEVINGTAKICFTCQQSFIEGAKANTLTFGESGEYDELKKLLNQYTDD